MYGVLDHDTGQSEMLMRRTYQALETVGVVDGEYQVDGVALVEGTC